MMSEERKAYYRAWYASHKEQHKATVKEWRAANRDYSKAYYKSDVNSFGVPKSIIRKKSWRILKKMHLHIPGYQIHHCFTYDDASKFIYISRSLHVKIHQYLRDTNIDADSDHWMAIRDIVNSTDEFKYIKC